jgi:hypothetical protein
MLKYLETQDVGPADHLRLDLAPRLNVLTGDNGLGKTFFLDVAWRAAAVDWASLPARPRRKEGRKPKIRFSFDDQEHELRFDIARQSWRAGRSRRSPVPPGGREAIVIYVRTDGGFSVWDPMRSAIVEPEQMPPYHFTPDTLWNGLQDGDHVLCNGLIRDWITWQDRQSPSFQMLEDVLEHLSPPTGETLRPGPPTRISVVDARDVPTIELPYETVPVVHAAAGMRRVLALAYLMVWAWSEHLAAAKLLDAPPLTRLLLLIDEVESHLHSQWQRALLPALLTVTEHLRGNLDLQILATTHATLVLASVEPKLDEERDALFVFDLEKDDVTVRRTQWPPRGDASGWLASEAPDLKAARSLPAQRAIRAAMETTRDPNPPVDEIRHQRRAVRNETDSVG